MSRQSSGRWYADRAAWRLIGMRYLPWLTVLSLAWEIAQLPLYTLWSEGSPAFIAFSVAHCTLGDVIVGAAALAVALIVTRSTELARWRWGRIAIATALGGAAYTAFSEWMNTVVLGNWTYSDLMPVLRVFGVEIGLSPIAQWLILPSIAFRLALTRNAVSGERS
ncbi:MAG: hypothetical protein HYX46_12675 [Betaproteobacteria bacterium]|nr:hypothetical protein [Betaproteobacteria bacterium]